ncbi:MAG: GIY-YIG nuclease family protein [Phycisphaerales bacterium]|nr:GIY-YIG nuclease family protein [Phycisphaerales bacterium]
MAHTPPPRRLPRFYVYLLLSERGEIYCGYTNCIKRRLKEHNATSNTGWTRGRRWYLLALKMFPDQHSALLVERRLKRSKYDKPNWIKRTGRLRTLCLRYGIQR